MNILRMPILPADLWATVSPDPVPEVEIGLHDIEGTEMLTADTDHADEAIPRAQLNLSALISRLDHLLTCELAKRGHEPTGPLSVAVREAARAAPAGCVSNAYPSLAGLEDLNLGNLRVLPAARHNAMLATATVRGDTVVVDFRGESATSKLPSPDPSIMAAHVTAMLSNMSPPTDADLQGHGGPLSIAVRISHDGGEAGFLARAECGSVDERRWTRWGIA